MKEVKKPTSRRNLDIAIDRLCTDLGEEPGRVKRLIAAVVVGQMLPDGAAKGGNALKIRFGKDVTRFSRDLDTARASSLNDYMTKLEDSLTIGWNGFSGAIVSRLHAASSPGSERAHDLIDLQIAISNEEIDYLKTREVCIRLFTYRAEQEWPPMISKGVGWDSLYFSQAEGLNVLPTVDDAVAWANDLIAKIDSAR